ncbi:MAG: pyridoxal phosphate-dependent aminotransferase [Myxococcales bacterium]|nr:pyridoxal phosphate-dependent aminotransferase [Myxococcales bacterium]MCB9668752.1 pyridoxal phosphate-dependent aminotransferase [Alphaproteobacteria bacterium]MCB9691451.1 pyridoxal phosphate-dependent aminotransferase [Alphaproteobacteria bacterium]
MPTLSARAHTLQESPIRKLDLTAMRFPEVRFHRLNIGQPDVPTPGPLLEAIRAFQPEVVAYGPASGLPACRDAAAAYHSRWGASLQREHVAVTTGGSEALLFAFAAMCDPGDEILVPEPYYTNYNGFGTVVGVTIRPIATRLEDGFAIPSDDVLDGLVNERTRAILFSNPGNPTGAVYGRDELERIIRWAARKDLFVIADEVYRRIWFDTPPTSALELGAPDHVVIIDSLSKTYSACGIRLGFLISQNGELMEKVERLGQSRLGPQPLAQHVGIAALGLPEDYYEHIRHIYRERVDAMMQAVTAVDGVRANRPAGAFYSMLDLPVDDADAFARFLITDFRLDGESVVVAPGGGFYADPARGRSQIRLAAVLERDRIERAAEILAAGIRAYGA